MRDDPCPFSRDPSYVTTFRHLKEAMLERSSPLPLYHQLKEILSTKIRRGEWKAGDLIPGEQELQSTYALSRTTARQALRELELDGVLTRHRGRGTFVARPKLVCDTGSAVIAASRSGTIASL